MHAVGVLQKLLQDSIPSLHLSRLKALMSAVLSAMTTRRLTLSGLARGLPAGQAIRHRIKRVDRLLGNTHLHNERPMVYQLLCRQFMGGIKRPVILVDWSDLKADRSWLVLRAALWTRGAAVPIYESVHPLRDKNSPNVGQMFLTKLKSLLPEGLRPIVVTDAGFRGPWFSYLTQLLDREDGESCAKFSAIPFPRIEKAQSPEHLPPIFHGRISRISQERKLHQLINEPHRKSHILFPNQKKVSDYIFGCGKCSLTPFLKNELMHHKIFHSREHARLAIFNYIEVFYNRQRIHQGLGYRTPAQVEASVP